MTMDERFQAMTESLEREITYRLALYGIPADSQEASMIVPEWRRQLENARDQYLIFHYGPPSPAET
jgi:hypothetical protein